MLFSKFCVYSSLLSPFFRVINIFRHGETKPLVQFLEKILSGLEQGKNLKFFTRVSFYHYLSIIYQANIKNVLYSLFVGSSRSKLESFNCISITFIQLQELFRRLQIVVSARSMLMCWVIYLSYSKMKKHYLC